MPYEVNKSRPVTVDVDREVYEKLALLADKKDTSIKKYINEVLQMNIERDEFLASYAPYLSLDGVGKNAIYIHDHKRKEDQPAVVRIRYKEKDTNDSRLVLECLLDNGATDCVHVRFALALPELGKLTKNLKELYPAKKVIEK